MNYFFSVVEKALNADVRSIKVLNTIAINQNPCKSGKERFA